MLALAAVPVHFGQSRADGAGSKPGVISDDFVAGSSGITINAPVTTKNEGVAFDAVFRVSDVNGLGIISYQLDVHYIPSVLQYNGCSVAGTISNVGTLLCNNSSAGTVEIVWNSTTALTNAPGGPASDLFKLNFTVVGSNGSSSTLTFTDVQVMEFAVPAVAIPGLITIGVPTAADVSIGGQVTTGTGRGVASARVSMQDGSGSIRNAITNGFGYYRFQDVQAGAVYVVSVSAKRYTFASRTISVADELVNLDFVAEP